LKRKPVIAGNLKMNRFVAQAATLATELKPLVSNANHCEVVVAPPFTALRAVADRLEGSNIRIGAQNIAREMAQGAHTGEISGDMLREAGCSYAIVGHSERRQMDCETDVIVNSKVRAAIHFGLIPIVCVGETLAEREAGRAEEVVRVQIERGLAELTGENVARIIIAYEPVWAIGTGRTATPLEAQSMHAFIRECLSVGFASEISQVVRILYGGSVKPDNISELMREPDIDGALVGGASLGVSGFARIVHYNA
jgi:triosephosphate isomerase (TIM)